MFIHRAFIALSILEFSLLVLCQDDCPEGFDTIPNLTCAMIVNGKTTWFDAFRVCEEYNATLPFLDEEDINDALKAYLLDQSG